MNTILFEKITKAMKDEIRYKISLNNLDYVLKDYS